MIYDKKAKTCVDIFTNPYFRDYEVAVNTDGIILLLQNGEVISSVDSQRFQADPMETFDAVTKETIDTSTHPYFKDYEIAFEENRILMLQYGSVKCCANSNL